MIISTTRLLGHPGRAEINAACSWVGRRSPSRQSMQLTSSGRHRGGRAANQAIRAARFADPTSDVDDCSRNTNRAKLGRRYLRRLSGGDVNYLAVPFSDTDMAGTQSVVYIDHAEAPSVSQAARPDEPVERQAGRRLHRLGVN